MRAFFRGVLILLVGLGVAFGVFRALGWPSTLDVPGPGNEIGFNAVKEGELLHAGLGPFTVVGSKPVEITRVRPDLSPGVELVAVRLSIVGTPGYVPVGALRGEDARIEQLRAASGATLRSGQRGSFVLTFKVRAPGQYRIPRVTITYSSGWLRRSVALGPAITAEFPDATPTG